MYRDCTVQSDLTVVGRTVKFPTWNWLWSYPIWLVNGLPFPPVENRFKGFVKDWFEHCLGGFCLLAKICSLRLYLNWVHVWKIWVKGLHWFGQDRPEWRKGQGSDDDDGLTLFSSLNWELGSKDVVGIGCYGWLLLVIDFTTILW